MNTLTFSLLGPVQVSLDGNPIEGLNQKSIALLAYLIVEADHPHRREMLGSLLWENSSSLDVSNNLRQTLFRIRKSLGEVAQNRSAPPILLVNHETVQFNSDCSYKLDVDLFRKGFLTSTQQTDSVSLQIEQFQNIADHYRGEFLQDIHLTNCNNFEEWLVIQREQLNQKAILVLHHLVSLLEAQHRYKEAQVYSQKQLQIDSLNEEACRQYMRALVYDGERAKALSFYERWLTRFQNGLGVAPEAETRAVFAAIKDETFTKMVTSNQIDKQEKLASRPVCLDIPFVGRQEELKKLDQRVKLANSGTGQVACIRGEAGSGKTTLLTEFTNRLLGAIPDAIILSGNCSSFTDYNIPLQPFREIFHLLCGDFSNLHSNTSSTGEITLRLWSNLPHSLRIITDQGSDLLDLFNITSEQVLHRARVLFPAGSVVISRLEEIAAHRKSANRQVPQKQSVIFDQFTRVLRSLAAIHPIVIILDDLGWIDQDSAALIFHLTKRLTENRVFFLFAARPDPIGPVESQNSSSIRQLMLEMQRDYGDMIIDLDLCDGHSFVEECLDAIPCALSQEFHNRLFEFTGGHALFTIELLQSLNDEGQIYQDSEGRWLDNGDLNWQHLPARIEAVIARRLDMIPKEMLEILSVASVDGEIFTAEIVSQVMSLSSNTVLHALNGPLSQQYNLVHLEHIEEAGDHQLSRYKFRHILFRNYLYYQLEPASRENIHRQMGNLLAEWSGQDNEIMVNLDTQQFYNFVPQLAYHFEEGKSPLLAARYFYLLACLAYNHLAVQQSLKYCQHSLELISLIPESKESTNLQIQILILNGHATSLIKGWGNSQAIHYLEQAFELSLKIGDNTKLYPTFEFLSSLYCGRGDNINSMRLAQEFLDTAVRRSNFPWVYQAYQLLGQSYTIKGEHRKAVVYLDMFISSPYSRDDIGDHDLDVQGIPPQANARFLMSIAHCALGHLSEADFFSREGLDLARSSKAPGGIYYGIIMYCVTQSLMGVTISNLERHLNVLRSRIYNECLVTYSAWIDFFSGLDMIEKGNFLEGINTLEQINQKFDQAEFDFGKNFRNIKLLEAYIQAGDPRNGQELISTYQNHNIERDNHYFDSAFFRLQGELYALSSDWAQPEKLEIIEACFQKAFSVACDQEALIWELMAAMSKAGLRLRQGRPSDARTTLQSVLVAFPEDLDNEYLRRARTLLDHCR